MTTVLTEPSQSIATPTTRQVFRRARFWIVLVVFAVLVAIGYTLLAPPSLTQQPLAPDGTGQTGAGALVAVLRQHGVAITATTSLVDTEQAIQDPAATTLFVYDPNNFLDAAQLKSLPTLAGDVVVLSPGAHALRSLDSNITIIGTSAPTPSAHCTVPAARRAGAISDAGHAYRVAAGASGYHRCFPSGDNDFSLVQRTRSGSTLDVVGTTAAFTNRYIAESGNAALAINLLGSRKHLVWYLPSLEDIGVGGKTETPAQAAPAWFPFLSVLVLVVIIAAVIWRGRRFGPLVVEQLPVIVPASETMEGRARLYQSSSARTRALDSLRIGTIARVTRACGLPRTADVDAVAAAVAEATGRPLGTVREVLVDGIPYSDADLVRRSDALVELEAAVGQATRPSGSRSREPERTE